MPEEIMPNLFRVEVPLPRNPLKTLNSYVIKGPERNLIIDTGMNRKECLQAMSAGLEELSVDLHRTDFFITHLHADHLGLVSELATDTSTIYFNQPDAARLAPGSKIWGEQRNVARQNGFPEAEIREAIEKHPGFRYGTRGEMKYTLLQEGDTLDAGSYHFSCLATPGHTPGHLCLYDADQKLLVAGDHLLIDITPNISLWSDEGDPLTDYLASLDKILNLEVDLVLPGHRRLFRDCRARISELKRHHQERAEEVLHILKEGPLDAYQVASRMTWDLTVPWDQFPISQKWFAAGEALAHLRYLETQGRVRRIAQEQGVVFALA